MNRCSCAFSRQGISRRLFNSLIMSASSGGELLGVPVSRRCKQRPSNAPSAPKFLASQELRQIKLPQAFGQAHGLLTRCRRRSAPIPKPLIAECRHQHRRHEFYSATRFNALLLRNTRLLVQPYDSEPGAMLGRFCTIWCERGLAVC
jgi:hypothetical protein